MANTGLWENANGFNSLQHSAVVVASATRTQFLLDGKYIFHNNEFQVVDIRGAHLKTTQGKDSPQKGNYSACMIPV